MNDLYIPDSPERTMNENTMTWQPGETLPVSRRPGPQPFSAEAQPSQSTSMSDIQIMLQSMQSSIEKSFDDVKGRLSDLEARMTGVEEKQQEVVNIANTPTLSSSENELSRKRGSPPELQVCSFWCTFNTQMC